MPRWTTKVRYGLARWLLKAQTFNVVPPWVTASALNPSFRSLVADGYQKSSALFACVSALAFALPEAPLRVYDDEGDNGAALPRHPLRLRLRRPNPIMGEAELMATTMVYLAVGGNAYWHKVRGQGGQIVALKPYHAGQIIVAPGGPNWISHYLYDALGTQGTATDDGNLPRIPVEDIVHFKWPAVDPGQPWQSQPPILAAAAEVDSDVEAMRYIFALLKNDAIPRTVITVPGERVLEDDEYRRIKEQWEERYGAGKRGGVAVVEGGAKVDRLSLDLNELAFEALAKVPETRIAAALRVPPIIAGLSAGLDRSTYANYGEARKAFTQDTLIPLWNLIASEITADLLPEFGSGGVEVRFDTSRVAALQEDATQKYNRTVNAYKAQLLTKDEARQALGFGPSQNGDGDEYSSGGGGGAIGAPRQLPGQTEDTAPALEDEQAPKVYVLLSDGTSIELPSGAAKVLKARPDVFRDVVNTPEVAMVTFGVPIGATTTTTAPERKATDLEGYEAQIERAVYRYLRAEYRKAAEGVRSSAKAGVSESIVDQLGLDLGDGAAKVLRRHYPKVLKQAFEDASDTLDMDLAFSVQNKEVQGVLGELVDLVTRIAETTRQAIRALIGKAAAEGWSIDTLAEQIIQSGATTSKSRAVMIARTETATAYSMGSLLAYAQSKVVERVEWSATIDKLTCETCRALDGETRPLAEGKTFSGGFAHPPAHPNCRCAVLPLIT